MAEKEKEQCAKWKIEAQKKYRKGLYRSYLDAFTDGYNLAMQSEQSESYQDERLRNCFKRLVGLKQYKDRYGKTEHYERNQPKVWEEAFSIVAGDGIGLIEVELVREVAMSAALEKIIEMNRQTAKEQYGDAEKAESWACVRIARAALVS